jgi:hypothetical protein
MGSRGLVSFNQRIVFIEGSDSSADRDVYEAFYPPSVYNVSFVPAGDSATVQKTAERVNALLSSSCDFQHYYSIVDGDIPRSLDPPNGTTGRLFRLPVYHVENFLLASDAIFGVTAQLLGRKCPYAGPGEVEAELKGIVVSSEHVRAYAKALLDSQLAVAAKAAYDSIYSPANASPASRPNFRDAEVEASKQLQLAVKENTWHKRCKGRDVLKQFCSRHNFTYVHFRNLLIRAINNPPDELSRIMDEILR